MENEIRKTKIDVKKAFFDFLVSYPCKPKNREEYFQKFFDLIDYIFKGAKEIYMSELGKFVPIEDFKKIMLGELKKMIRSKKI